MPYGLRMLGLAITPPSYTLHNDCTGLDGPYSSAHSPHIASLVSFGKWFGAAERCCRTRLFVFCPFSFPKPIRPLASELSPGCPTANPEVAAPRSASNSLASIRHQGSIGGSSPYLLPPRDGIDAPRTPPLHDPASYKNSWPGHSERTMSISPTGAVTRSGAPQRMQNSRSHPFCSFTGRLQHTPLLPKGQVL